MMDSSQPRELYVSMLQCARAQAEAIQQDDWDAYSRLAGERQQLFDASEQALAEGALEEEVAADLIRAVLAADSETACMLEGKREKLSLRAGQFRRLVAAAGAYRARRPMQETGRLLDAHH